MAQQDLLDRTAALGCEPLGSVPAEAPLPNGAFAGVECATPIEGVAELKLFNLRGPYRLRQYHQARVDEAGVRVQPNPAACRQGQPGVRKWEHGRLACWRPVGRPKSVLHWTDDRTGLYGRIRAEAGANQRLAELWQTVMSELMPGAVLVDEEPSQDEP